MNNECVKHLSRIAELEAMNTNQIRMITEKRELIESQQQSIAELRTQLTAARNSLQEMNSEFDDLTYQKRASDDRWVNAEAQLAAEREKLTEAKTLLQDTIDGVGCQPGYIRSLTIQRIENFIAAQTKEGE